MGDALNGKMTLQLMALLVLFKLLAVTVSYASGNAGGIFGPSLFIGAMLGGTVGSVTHGLFPQHTAALGAYALVGMGTAFAGIVRAPMTSVIMIFEVTRDYTIIVPLMISNTVSFFISTRLQPRPIYEALALQEGIHLPSAETRQQHTGRSVAEAMQPAGEVLSAAMTVDEGLRRVKGSRVRSWPVLDETGVIGIIRATELEESGERGGDVRRIRELIHSDAFPHVHPDQSVHLALERMTSAGLNVLPVVSRADAHSLLGVVVLGDLLRALGVPERGQD